MNVEDSYEGAVRRLRRLGHAGVDFAPSPARSRKSEDTSDRMRDLEELATLACEENEQLKRELDDARSEMERLRRLVSTLQETLTLSQSNDHFSEQVPRRRGGVFWFFAIVIVGGGAAASFMLRPWERFHLGLATTSAVTAPAVETSAPVVAAPPPSVAKVEAPAPAVAPTPAKVEATIPKVEAMIPKVEPAAPAKAERHHSKHHAQKSSHHEKKERGAAGKSHKKPADTDDPLGGLSL